MPETKEGPTKIRHDVRNLLIAVMIFGPALPFFVYNLSQLPALWPAYHCILTESWLYGWIYSCSDTFGYVATQVAITMQLSIICVTLILFTIIEHVQRAQQPTRVWFQWYFFWFFVAFIVPNLILGIMGLELTTPFKHCPPGDAYDAFYGYPPCTPPEYQVFISLVCIGITTVIMAVIILIVISSKSDEEKGEVKVDPYVKLEGELKELIAKLKQENPAKRR